VESDWDEEKNDTIMHYAVRDPDGEVDLMETLVTMTEKPKWSGLVDNDGNVLERKHYKFESVGR
jgi:hypothetical protein